MNNEVAYKILGFDVGNSRMHVEFFDPFFDQDVKLGRVAVTTGDHAADGKPIVAPSRGALSTGRSERLFIRVEVRDGKVDNALTREHLERTARSLYRQFESRARTLESPAQVTTALGIPSEGRVPVPG